MIVTVGYNRDKEFFNLIRFYKRSIEEYYFSLTNEMMSLRPFNPEEVARELSSLDQFGIPGNLLLNTQYAKDYFSLISIAKNCCDLKSVSVLSYDIARDIKQKYPELNIHYSTHCCDLTEEQFDSDIIYAYNVPEPYYYRDKHLIKAAKKQKIKIKYIANRGCIQGKVSTIEAITHHPHKCCEESCKKKFKEYPWLELLSSQIFKEWVPFYQPDIIKLSTRPLNLKQISQLIKYWVSSQQTKIAYGINITDKNIDTFIEWGKIKAAANSPEELFLLSTDYYHRLTS